MDISTNYSLILYDRQDKPAVNPLEQADKPTVHRHQPEKSDKRHLTPISDEMKDIDHPYSFNKSLETRETDYLGFIVDTYA